VERGSIRDCKVSSRKQGASPGRIRRWVIEGGIKGRADWRASPVPFGSFCSQNVMGMGELTFSSHTFLGILSKEGITRKICLRGRFFTESRTHCTIGFP
jgi:hypothetical protein